MIKTAKFIFLGLLMLNCFSFSYAQSTKSDAKSKKQFLEQVFNSAKEQYFSFSFESKEQVRFLTKIISIDKIVESTVYAYASRDDFEKFLDTKIAYQLLDHPNTFFKASMFDPKLKQSFAWDKYLGYNEYVTMMYQFAADYPDICQVFSLGQSVEGRELLVAKISDNVSVTEAEPQFFYSGQIHGDELVTSILMLRLIDHLTANYTSDTQVSRLVDNIEIWINPMSNPDGTYAGGNLTVNGATRFNANATDINRNFPDPEDGPHPDGKTWQPETQIFMALAEAQNFVMSANTHSGITVVNYPWDTWSRRHADDDWWQLVSREYADLAQLYSPAGYMEAFDDGITNGYDWYTVAGGRQDYMNYFQHCREVTIEQSVQKYVPEADLPDYWDYNRKAMLNYLEQVSYGFRGRVTDSLSGDPIETKIEIEGHDFDQSFVFSNSLGYYYRPIKAGTYTLVFSSDGYKSKKLSNQIIADFDSKTIDVILQKLDTGLNTENLSNLKIINPVQNYNLHIISPVKINKIKIYSVLGQLVLSELTNTADLKIDIHYLNAGVYFIYMEFSSGESIQRRFIVP